MIMKTKLTRVDEGAALLFDRPLLEKLGLHDDAEVELSMSGDVLTITPVRDAVREQLFASLSKRCSPNTPSCSSD